MQNFETQPEIVMQIQCWLWPTKKLILIQLTAENSGVAQLSPSLLDVKLHKLYPMMHKTCQLYIVHCYFD